MAKNIVAAGIADRCELQLAYAIGVATSIICDTFGTGKISDDEIVELINKNFDLRPAAIIRDLDLEDLSTSRLQPMDILVGQI